MESYTLPIYSARVHIALFTGLSNASPLRQRLISASALPTDAEGNRERAKLDFAFADASMITSRLQLLTAISQALLVRAAGALKTKTVHSEVLWELEPGNNITESLKHFGLSASTTSLVLVHIAPLSTEDEADSDRAVFERMQDLVEGTLCSLDALGQLPVGQDGKGGTNTKMLRKLYKLNQDVVLAGISPGSVEERHLVDELVVGAVALKEAS